MRKLKTGFLAIMLAAGAFCLSGCVQMDDDLLANNADFSVFSHISFLLKARNNLRIFIGFLPDSAVHCPFRIGSLIRIT